MQLKGLVRFFAILLIVYSIYQLSFTWFVRNHEKKLEARAKSFMNNSHPDAKGEAYDSLYASEVKRLKQDTKDETITYGITGAVSYQKAQEEELNLGLDLQGGMNVTMEVEMSGLIKTLANNSKDPQFLKAIQNADLRKANSDANFIRLFADEYEKLVGSGKLAGVFAPASGGDIKIGDGDSKVISVLQDRSRDAFDNTYRVIRTRIDQFGVAQPNINPDRDRQTISVELPGVDDKDRVRSYLQSTANLQFWELYNFRELQASIENADKAFNTIMGGKTTPDSSATPDSGSLTAAKDTSKSLVNLNDTSKNKNATLEKDGDAEAKKHLYGYMSFIPPQQDQGREVYRASIAYVPIKDTAKVRGYLQMAGVRSFFPSQLVWMYGKPQRDDDGRALNVVELYAIKTFGRDHAKLEGDAVRTASQDFDQTGKPEVRMDMTNDGAKIWGDLTTANKGKPIAIALDNIVYSAPNVNDPILGGNSQISGGFTVTEAQDLANILKAGKLPAPAHIVQEQQVGATLGKEAINDGMMAFGLSFLVIFILMLVYYNTAGWIANIALILNLLFTVGVLAGLGATLTAPGIAGLVLTIGMAVDTNVIIYERIKEELTRGKGYIPAINEGYRRSLPPVLDGHITTLLTAIILFYFGLGPVKGFATTQIIGILLSLFCGILISRWISDMFTNKKRHLEYFTGISRKIFRHANYKFIEFRKVAYIISFVVLALGIASFFNGFDYGVEFDGGRSYTVKFGQPIANDVERIRESLKTSFEGENPVLKTVGDNRTLDIITSYKITDSRPSVDSLVENRLFAGLKDYKTPVIEGYSKVLPTISDDLKKGAYKATIFALIVIFLYIFLRFRDWRYSLGTIIALLHDVFVTLIVFSFAKSIVPFPLEIDQHFIAALLTVIGFSMNDTVIIFDRIREDRRLYPTASLAQTINRAINETLSRTVMTSLTVFLTILILFLVGGEVTRGFAFAMLIGVITGIYSSIFVAAPILLDLGSGKKKLEPSAPISSKPVVTEKRPTTI